jgi:hypothetical protein
VIVDGVLIFLVPPQKGELDLADSCLTASSASEVAPLVALRLFRVIDANGLGWPRFVSCKYLNVPRFRLKANLVRCTCGAAERTPTCLDCDSGLGTHIHETIHHADHNLVKGRNFNWVKMGLP